jgi:hypothetical protein
VLCIDSDKLSLPFFAFWAISISIELLSSSFSFVSRGDGGLGHGDPDSALGEVEISFFCLFSFPVLKSGTAIGVISSYIDLRYFVK